MVQPLPFPSPAMSEGTRASSLWARWRGQRLLIKMSHSWAAPQSHVGLCPHPGL